MVRAAPLTRRAAAHVLTPPGLRRCAGSASAADLICGMEELYTYDTILEAYEQAPDDTDRVATLMQKMQACGPPPPEIAGPVADGVGCCIS